MLTCNKSTTLLIVIVFVTTIVCQTINNRLHNKNFALIDHYPLNYPALFARLPRQTYYQPVAGYNQESKNLLDQRIYGNPVLQCPCVIKASTDKCITYDSRYQAATPEEAIIAFRDVTLDDHGVEQPNVADLNKLFRCETLECRTCASLLHARLKSIGLLDQDEPISLPIAEHADARYCQRLRFLQPKIIPNVPPPPEHVQKLIERGQQHARLIDNQPPMNLPANSNDFWIPPSPPPLLAFPQSSISPFFPLTAETLTIRRRRYETSMVTPNLIHSNYERLNSTRRVQREAVAANVIGRRYTISCFERGEANDHDYMSLCGACWTWRKLPTNYFPPLINELVCSTSAGGYCLSGWGQCQQQFRSFDVLKRENDKWSATTISAATCCKCHVRAGTEMHALVVGKV